MVEAKRLVDFLASYELVEDQKRHQAIRPQTAEQDSALGQITELLAGCDKGPNYRYTTPRWRRGLRASSKRDSDQSRLCL